MTTTHDDELWVRLFEPIRPNVASTDASITHTNIAFDAMKEKTANLKSQQQENEE